MARLTKLPQKKDQKEESWPELTAVPTGALEQSCQRCLLV